MERIDLQDTTVAITGAARGIGLATARELLARGARVAIGDIAADLAAQTAAELGPQARGLALDVTDRGSFDHFLATAESELGPVEVLVNNAGVMPAGPFLDEDDETTEAAIGVNLWGPIHGMRAALPAMLERGHGHVVNVASMMGKVYLPGVATYSGAKYGVVGLSRAVRDELHGTGVTVTVVLPSATNTELVSGIKLPGVLPDVEPEDVARAIADSCAHRRAEVSVPGWVGPMAPLADLAPSALTGPLRRLLRHDRALTADREARAPYEQRARRPGS